MLSKKDKLILNYIYEHSSVTINQCAKCIFTGNRYAYDQARKKLRQLYKERAIARYRSKIASETIYYINTRLGIHGLKLLDIYAELVSMEAKVQCFQKAYRIYTNENRKKYREIDALIELEYNSYFIPLIIEIDYSHMTGFKKLQEIYDSNHFQEKYKNYGDNIFPLIIICRPVVENHLSTENAFSVLYTDFGLKNLALALE